MFYFDFIQFIFRVLFLYLLYISIKIFLFENILVLCKLKTVNKIMKLLVKTRTISYILWIKIVLVLYDTYVTFNIWFIQYNVHWKILVRFLLYTLIAQLFAFWLKILLKKWDIFVIVAYRIWRVVRNFLNIFECIFLLCI